jgi:hypothetical protein
MARHSAINAVANAVLTTLNVASLRALCPGGVYRNRPTAQTTPYVSLGPCREVGEDVFGVTYGAIVTVPVRVFTSSADADGESRVVTILDAAMALLDEPATWAAVTGWTVTLVDWQGTEIAELDSLDEGGPGYLGISVFAVHVSVT